MRGVFPVFSGVSFAGDDGLACEFTDVFPGGKERVR